jgi:hypothetical protein
MYHFPRFGDVAIASECVLRVMMQPLAISTHPNDFGAISTCKTLGFNDKRIRVSLVFDVPNAVFVMPNRYAHVSVVVIGIGCGNRTSNTNVA